MALTAIGFGCGHSADVMGLQKLPAFRKATRAMMLSSAAIDRAIASAGVQALIKERPELFSLLTASSFGELETTKDFLKSLADTGVARPLLFQNSLHNSTTGFLCIQHKLSAPALTFSHGCFAGEQALNAAELLLAQDMASFCIVNTVDTFISELLGSASDKEKLRENAACIIFAAPAMLERYSLKPLLMINDVRTVREGGKQMPSYAQLASAQADVVTALSKINRDAASGGDLRIEKPSVGFSTLKWVRA